MRVILLWRGVEAVRTWVYGGWGGGLEAGGTEAWGVERNFAQERPYLCKRVDYIEDYIT